MCIRRAVGHDEGGGVPIRKMKMKKLIVFFAIVCFSVAGAQDGKRVMDRIQSICKTWIFSYSIVNGKKARFIYDFQLILHPDNTFTQVLNGTKEKGVWCYDPKNDWFEISDPPNTPNPRKTLLLVLVKPNEVLMVSEFDYIHRKGTYPKDYAIYKSF